MVTRITRLLLALQGMVALAIALAVLYVLELDLLTAVALAFAFVLLVRMTITANNFFINRYYCGRVPEAPCLSLTELVRLYLTEFRTTMYCSSWSMPFFAFSKRTPAHPAGLPVLLVHGYGCNSGYWHGMSKALMHANIVHHAVDLEPVLADIEDYVPRIREAINALCADTGHEKVIILAHSMGGLATRAYLRQQGAARIAKVITLGSPHRGTGLANFGLGPNSQQMRWIGTAEQGEACDWLCQLEADENEELMSLFVSLYSYHDNIVAPQTSSCLPGAKNISFKGIGHVALAYSPEVQACVIKEILAVPAHQQTSHKSALR